MTTHTLKYSKIILGLLSVCLVGGLSVYAINTTSDGYKFTSAEIKNVTLADGGCRKITNNATTRFVPTKSMAEWNSFNSVVGSLGITVAACVTPCPTDYYQAPNGLCISKLYGPTNYQTAWNNCLSAGSILADNGIMRDGSVSSVCAQSGNCGPIGTLPNGKMIWSSSARTYNTTTYNNYYMSICGSDGCQAHTGEFAVSGYPSGSVSYWGTASDPADGSHYYFCVKTGCPPNMELINGQCYSEILGPSTFTNAYNTCVGTYGTTILTDKDINNVAWRSWDAGQVNYSVTLPNGTQFGSTSCYPSIFPPPNQDVSCWGTAPTINQVFSADHIATGAAGLYNGTAWYRCQKSAS